MTLEQIKIRQEQLNEYLLVVLQQSVNTVDYIAGKGDEKEEPLTPMKEPNGLLEQLTYQQDRTERLISHLSNNHNRLSSYTFTPVPCETASYNTECVGKVSVY